MTKLQRDHAEDALLDRMSVDCASFPHHCILGKSPERDRLQRKGVIRPVWAKEGAAGSRRRWALAPDGEAKS